MINNHTCVRSKTFSIVFIIIPAKAAMMATSFSSHSSLLVFPFYVMWLVEAWQKVLGLSKIPTTSKSVFITYSLFGFNKHMLQYISTKILHT